MTQDNSKLESGWYWKHIVIRGSSPTSHHTRVIHFYHKGKTLCSQLTDYEIKLKPYNGNEKRKCKSCKISLNTYKDLNNIVERKKIANE